MLLLFAMSNAGTLCFQQSSCVVIIKDKVYSFIFEAVKCQSWWNSGVFVSYNSNVSWVDIRALVWSVAQGACHVICPLLGLYLWAHWLLWDLDTCVCERKRERLVVYLSTTEIRERELQCNGRNRYEMVKFRQPILCLLCGYFLVWCLSGDASQPSKAASLSLSYSRMH